MAVWASAIVLAMTVLSCGDSSTPRFFVQVERDFNVDNSLNAIETHFFELKNIPTNLNHNLDIYGLAEDNIASIGSADATLSTAAGFMDWSLVSFVEIYAISRINPSHRERIFYINSRDPGGQNNLKLFNTFAELSTLMKEETIDLEVRLRTITPVSGNFRARLWFTYAVFDEI